MRDAGLAHAPALLAGLLLASCAGHGIEVRRAIPPDGLEVRGVAVYPVRFTWEEGSVRSVEVAQRQLEHVVRHGRLVAIGPTELTITGTWDDDPYRSSDAAHRLFAAGVKPDEGIVLRLTADDRVERSSRLVLDGSGKARGARSEEDRTLKVELEVVHPSSHRRLYVLTAERKVDPFAEDRPEWDPLPELTALAGELTTRALAVLVEDGLVKRPPRALPFDWFHSPVAAFSHSPDDRSPFSAELEKLDALGAEVAIDRHVRFAAPGADDATIRRLAHIRDGTLLVARTPEKSLLQPGDRVIAADGEPVTGPHVVHRRLLRAASALTLEIERRGQRQRVLLPAR